MAVRAHSAESPLVTATDWDRLAERVRLARRRAASHRADGVLAAITVRVAGDVDPTAVVAGARRPGEPWFALEQPDRDRSALAALGCVLALEASGGDRFSRLAARWRTLAAAAVCDPVDGPRGSGVVALGGFAFADDGGQTPAWSGFSPASLHVPQVALARRGDDVRLTLAARVCPDDEPAEVIAALRARVDALRFDPLPLWDPAPASRARVVSVMPPAHYEQAVGRATERIGAGDLQKIVLAREVDVHAGAPHDPAAILGVLREEFPSCYVFAVGRGDATLVAASPELLVRRDGMRAGTLALAGSTRRSAEPSVDQHLGAQLLSSAKDREEHAIVIRRIAEALAPLSVWVTAPDEPVTVQMTNIQHLATPIRAQLAAPVSALTLAGTLHPTPAVGGEPLAATAPLIPALEGLDRGWYAGPVGWVDTNEDGEFCVALRCALLRGALARLYAGVGVVRDSDPAAELAETDVKLQALLPILSQ
jgi:salicylate biosynthesis isochorismate synthase/menaquinone-specific isochorismate synthase